MTTFTTAFLSVDQHVVVPIPSWSQQLAGAMLGLSPDELPARPPPGFTVPLRS
jgi:hypothetical protein